MNMKGYVHEGAQQDRHMNKVVGRDGQTRREKGHHFHSKSKFSNAWP